MGGRDISGLTFNKLTVVGRSGLKAKYGADLWNCICVCGNSKLAAYSHLNNGTVSSCGCAIRTTKEQFVEKARRIHGDKYTYENVVYTHSQDKVSITCPTHGDFITTPAIHTMGSGCKECSKKTTGEKLRVSLGDFLKAAKVKHGDRYDYSLITEENYKGVSKKVEIICREHGKFFQTGALHLSGATSCKSCIGKIHNIESFLKACKRVHGDLYDYSKVDFKSTKKNVDIICKTHGVFSQQPHNHIAGKHGCPTCGACGFDQTLASSLYVMTFGDITKVGVTNRTANQRAISLRCNTKREFKVFKEYSKLDGKLCWDIETLLLKDMSERYKKVEDKFDGSTECFYDVDMAWLLNKIEDYIMRYR